jgi:hypothetical protein
MGSLQFVPRLFTGTSGVNERGITSLRYTHVAVIKC